ncbi:MAG: hypothetical protein ACOYB4_12165, partial [Methyloceanibacter sp.]
ADLPEANSLAIYRRMQTERQRQASEIRAQGEEASRRIRANADRQVTVLKAEATGESSRIRGEGDGEKNRIFAEAFNQDADFFSFYRSMQAYEGALKSTDTRLLLSPDSEFFQYFNDPAGRPGSGNSTEPSVPKAAPSTPAPEVPEEEPGDMQQGAVPNGSGTQQSTADTGGEPGQAAATESQPLEPSAP